MWCDFLQWLCDVLGWCGFVYLWLGYGWLMLCLFDECWVFDFMYWQVYEVLFVLLEEFGVSGLYWLFGYSDGGLIVLLYVVKFLQCVVGVIVLVLYIFVEDILVVLIVKMCEVYLIIDLCLRLVWYYQDVDFVFWGWNDIWLDLVFCDWFIENEIRDIVCLLLVVQGLDDEYGMLEQICGIVWCVF